MEELQVKTEEMRRAIDSLSGRLDNVVSEVSDLKDSVKRALDNLLPKVEDLLLNQASNVSNSAVTQRPDSSVVSSMSLFQAAEVGDVEAILRLLTDGVERQQWNEQGDSALHVAARGGHLHAVTVLVGNFPVDIIGHRGRTALHWASAEGHEKVVHQLLLARANCDAEDCDGDFPLLSAAKAGHANVVEVLANHNAHLDSVDRNENSALVAAAKSKHWEIVKILLVRGASAEIYEGDDNAPLYLVAKERNYSLLTTMIKKIERKEEEMKLALLKCKDPYLVFVFENSFSGFCTTDGGRHAMRQLAAGGNVDVLRAMLDRGADVDGYSNGSFCLLEAAIYGRVEALKLLLERGASVDQQGKYTLRSPLHCAAEEGHVECVRLLLEAGSSFQIKNKESKTPIDGAKTDEIRQLLTSHSSQT